MSLSVIVYQVREHTRSRVICEAMLEGMRRQGQRVAHRWEDEYSGVDADVAVFYGLEGKLSKVFADYSAAAKAVYIDLGYWARKEPDDRWGGYHKLAVNDRHPTAYFQNVKHGPERAAVVGAKALPWKASGSHILLAGMGDKGAKAEGFAPEEWERDAINQIRQYTKRAIIYRPKPSWKGARPIAGVGYASTRDKDVGKFLRNCHAVVTHHSNVAVDGLVLGIPAFAWRGVAMPMSSQDLSEIETPVRLEGRQQWLNDIAHVQYNVEEMKRGVAWRYLLEEGLV